VLASIFESLFWSSNRTQDRFQRAFDAQTFGVEIAHGGFERAVAHRLLNRPRTDPVLHAMRCVTVPVIPSSE
jgi:hypothetical protein